MIFISMKDKMHKRPFSIAKIDRVVIQDDGLVHLRVPKASIVGHQAQDIQFGIPLVMSGDRLE